MSLPPEELGSFPMRGPVTYLHLSPEEVDDAFRGPRPPIRRWFHATRAEFIGSICVQGILPSCWSGGDTCGVCGYDKLTQLPAELGQWALEVESPALPGDLKAWWVPSTAIRGAWCDGLFYPADALRIDARPLLTPTGCPCEMSAMTDDQIAIWRTTWSSAP